MSDDWTFSGFMVDGKLFANKAIHHSGFVVEFSETLTTRAALKIAKEKFASRDTETKDG